jgi:hypothetical protein
VREHALGVAHTDYYRGTAQVLHFISIVLLDEGKSNPTQIDKFYPISKHVIFDLVIHRNSPFRYNL